LLRFATEIKEIDLNPLIGSQKDITVVDARIRIEKPATGNIINLEK